MPSEAVITAGRPSLLPSREVEIKRTFDPLTEWHRINASVLQELQTQGKEYDFDARIEREHRHFDELAQHVVGSEVESYAELHSRLRGAQSSERVLENIQRLNRQLDPGFEISEIVTPRAVTELIAQEDYTHDRLVYWRDTGKLDKRWVPILPSDALAVSSGIGALANREHIPLGRRVIDLGGGTGTWGFMLAQLGFDVLLIERDQQLIEEFQRQKAYLEQIGVRTGHIAALQGEFSASDSKNTPAIRTALENADLMVCYPWPQEVEERLRIFHQYGKPDALLVLYGGAMDDMILRPQWLQDNQLEVVGKEIRDAMAQQKAAYFVRGFEAFSFGSNWLMLQKKSPATMANPVLFGSYKAA